MSVNGARWSHQMMKQNNLLNLFLWYDSVLRTFFLIRKRVFLNHEIFRALFFLQLQLL